VIKKVTDNDMPENNNDEELLSLFCNEIVRCMVKYGQITEQEAQWRLDKSRLCATNETEREGYRSMLFHDPPYFWAMHILHSKQNPQWFNDPGLHLWPPPEDWVQEYRARVDELNA
jgi:hypothetical protein